VWTSIGIRKDDKMELIRMIALMCIIITTSLMIVMTIFNMVNAIKRDKAYLRALDEMVESAIKSFNESFNERSEEE
jgi:hypothetical protein